MARKPADQPMLVFLRLGGGGNRLRRYNFKQIRNLKVKDSSGNE
jgi:hypothetical protein